MRNLRRRTRQGPAWAALALAVVLAGCTAAPVDGRSETSAAATATATATARATATAMAKATATATAAASERAPAARQTVTAAPAPTQQALNQEEQMNLDQELIRAAKNNNPNLVRELIAAGGDVNAKDSIQDSAFLYAGAEGFNEVLVLTLDSGADVRSTNRYGGTALIPASEHGHLETIRILIAAGVPVNHVNNLGWTALQEAILLNNGGEIQQQAVKLLLAGGADPGIRDLEGRTALDNAERLGFTAIATQIRASGFGAS